MTDNKQATMHTEYLAGRDMVTGQDLEYTVLWLDRDPYCECGEYVGTGECPVVLNTGAGQGGRLDEFSQQHGCGAWNSIEWVSAGERPTQEELDAAVRELTA